MTVIKSQVYKNDLLVHNSKPRLKDSDYDGLSFKEWFFFIKIELNYGDRAEIKLYDGIYEMDITDMILSMCDIKYNKE